MEVLRVKEKVRLDFPVKTMYFPVKETLMEVLEVKKEELKQKPMKVTLKINNKK